MRNIIGLFIFGLTIGLSSPKLSNNDRVRERLEAVKDLPEGLTSPELIKYWGYPVEEHWVTTEDGYILGLHRIPHGKDQEPGGRRPVAYLQHALITSSSLWVFGPPKKSLAYILADLGYDVWMGNSRGNPYSKNHTYLEPCSGSRCKEFWDFDWHEGGIYDVTAGIDYALEYTKQDSVYYAGHSMGTTQYVVMLSQRPEYNNKIKIGALLAPPVFMGHASNFIFDIASLAGGIEIIYHLLGQYEFLPHLDLISWIGDMFCGDDHPLTNLVCMNMGFILLGFNPGQLNSTMIPTYLDHIPQSSSTRTFAHYAQLYLSKGFEGYDFGETENIIHYGQPTPPVYDLNKVTAPTAIFKGDADSLCSLVDVDILVNRLPNVVFDHLVEMDGWTHTDYVISMDADYLVYKYVTEIFSQY